MAECSIVLKNGRIVDGTGAPWFRGDIGISEGKIAYVGAPGNISAVETGNVIDVGDKVISPGFIDVHAHSDFLLLRDPLNLSKISQGVTTEIEGQCGISPAPISEQSRELIKLYTRFAQAGVSLDWDWDGLASYYDQIEKLGIGINVGFFVGHGTIRLAVMGFRNDKPTPKELEEMKKLVASSMEDGALGMTSGLIYPPGIYSTSEELIELCRVVASYGGIYASHMRSESDGLLEAIREAIQIGEQAGIPVQISHHKAFGKHCWGKVKESLQLIEEARARGVDITVDQYPYTATSTTLSAMLPAWAQEGGVEKLCARLSDPQERTRMRKDIEEKTDWENQVKACGTLDGILVVYAPETPNIQGKTIGATARELKTDALELAFDVIKANRGAATACYFAMCEDDVEYVMRHRLVMVGSDSIPAPPSAKPHPRTNGTFPRILGHYSRDKEVLPLEEAVRKMTSLPAARLKLAEKGQIAVGKDADLVVFDPKTIKDCATYENGDLPPEGIDYVFVNGTMVMDHGQHTGKRPGRVLRKRM